MKRFPILLALVLVAITLVLPGCDNAANPANVAGKDVTPQVVNYGNGVYYFLTNVSDFGNSLSKFIAEHPELEVSAMAGNGTGFYGADIGYFVTFKEKAKSPPDASGSDVR